VLVAGSDGRDWGRAGSVAAARSSVPLGVYQVGVDFQDVSGHWAQAHQVTDTGAVLVRPDGIVGWRCIEAPSSPGEEIDRVFQRLLARRPAVLKVKLDYRGDTRCRCE